MFKKSLTFLMLALTTLNPLLSRASLAQICDPQTHFCIFIRGDATLPTEVSVDTIMSLSVNRSVLKYPGHLTIRASAFQVVGLPTKVLNDAKVNRLSFEISSVSGQAMSLCEVSSLDNKVVLPGLHIISLSATRDNNSIQFHCTVEK